MVAADEAADAGRHMDISTGADCQAEFARLDVHALADRRDEGRPAELGYRQAQQQVLHRRVAADHHIDDVARLCGNSPAQIMGQSVEGCDRGSAQFVPTAGMRRGMIHPADHVGTPAHLRVLDGQGGQALAALQVDQESRHVGGPEVDREAQAGATRCGHADQFLLPNADAQRPGTRAQHRRQLPHRFQIQAQVLAGEGAPQSLDVAGGVGQAGRFQLQVPAAHHRVQRQRLAVFAARHIGAHHACERARRHFHRAVRQGVQLTGALPRFAAAVRPVRLGAYRSQRSDLDLTFDDVDGTGSAGAAAAAGTDDPHPVAARALKQGIAALDGHDLVQVRKPQLVARRRGGNVRIAGHGGRAILKRQWPLFKPWRPQRARANAHRRWRAICRCRSATRRWRAGLCPRPAPSTWT